MIDYSEASGTYDDTRHCDGALIELMARRGAFAARASGEGARRARVLDFGCGTGNYLAELSRRFDCELFGLESSDAMREIASSKCPLSRIEKGYHSSLPFERGFFDFVFMTDVVHHVPDIPEIERRAAMAGFRCAGTEIKANPGPHVVDGAFLRMVGEKNYSMFKLLSEAEYESGYAAMRTEEGRIFISPGAGETLLWLGKGEA